MIAKTFPVVILAVVSVLFDSAESHGRFMKPVSRSSVWRVPEFQDRDPPPNYNDMELFCGNVLQNENPGTNCGVCGDPFSDPTPRANEIGGKYYRGIITAEYSSGQVIDVEVEITAAHLGFMEWRLCTNPSTETQECFNQHLLQRADGLGTQLNVSDIGMYRTSLKLPEGIWCNHCIIQWNYKAGNNWGQCEDGSVGVGCGPQENFRGCSDVSIIRSMKRKYMYM